MATKDVDMVLVMGLSGAGKSHFINTLTGAETGDEDCAEVGKKLKSKTQKCQAVATAIGNTDFVIVDCPGFDDTDRSDTEILREITQTLSTLYLLGLKLKGVIYLQRITDVRMQGSSMKNLQLFVRMVGKEHLENVVFVTTMWDKLKEKELKEAIERDNELRDEYWGEFLSLGATATRFENSTASAEGILSILLGKKDTQLRVLNQLVNDKKALKQTDVGAFLEPRVKQQEADYTYRIDELEQQLKLERNTSRKLNAQRWKRQAEEGKQKQKQDRETLDSKPGVEAKKTLENLREGSLHMWKNALQALAAVISISVAITGMVLSNS